MPLSPLVAALVVPFLTAFGASGLLRGAAATPRRAAATGCAIGVGFLAAFIALTGSLPFAGSAPHPAVAAMGAGLTLAGAALSVLKIADRLLKFPVVLAAPGAALWCFGGDPLSMEDAARCGASVVLGLVVSLRVASLVGTGAAPVGMIAAAACGLAGIAFEGRGALDAGLAVALAASCGGWLLQARKQGRRVTGGVAMLLGSGLLVALATDAARTALHPPWAMLLLPACFWGEVVARRAGLARLLRRKATRGLGAALGAGICAGASVIAAAALAVAAEHGA